MDYIARNRARKDAMVYYLLVETNLLKTEIARMVQVDSALVARLSEGGFKKRKDKRLTAEELDDFQDFLIALDELLDEEFGTY